MREENVEEEEAIITKTNDMKYTSYKKYNLQDWLLLLFELFLFRIYSLMIHFNAICGMVADLISKTA